jgi:hypothetical protein
MTTQLNPNPLTLSRVPLERIRPNTYQVRRTEDPAHIRRLAANIAGLKRLLPETLGLQQPPTARLVNADGTPADPTAYNDLSKLTPEFLAEHDLYAELHFGHSRVGGCHILHDGAPADPDDPESEAFEADPDYALIPMFLRHADDATMWRTAIGENTLRQDITAIEEAIAITRAVDELGITQADAGAAMGLTPSATANKVRLLQLPDAIKAAVLNRHVAETSARALLPLAPAQHLLTRIDPDNLAIATRSTIESFVAETVTDCPPLPLGDKVAYRQWDYSRRTFAKSPKLHNQPFDYDWQPPADEPRALGPCTGCQFNVTFNGDDGPRCTQTGNNTSPCYEAKKRAWDNEERAQQIAAANAAREAQMAQSAHFVSAATQAARAVTAAAAQDATPPATITPNGEHATMPPPAAPPSPPPSPPQPNIYSLDDLADGAPLAEGDQIHGNIAAADEPPQPVRVIITHLLARGHQFNEYDEPAVVIADVDENGKWDADAQTVMPISTFEQMLDRSFTLPAEALIEIARAPTPASPLEAAEAALEAATAQAAPPSPRELVFKSKKLKVLGEVSYSASWFGDYNTPAALVDHGLCSADRCECMALAYNPHPNNNHLRPDPQGAPNMCLVCTSNNRLANRKREMEHGNLKSYRAAVRANREHAKTMLKAAWLEIDPRDLHTHPVYLRQMLALDNKNCRQAAPDDLPFLLFCALADQRCKDGTNVTVDAEQRHWNLDTLKVWIAKVTGEQPAYPKPEGWDELDDKAVATYYADGYKSDKLDRPRALRWLAQFRLDHEHDYMLRQADKLEKPFEDPKASAAGSKSAATTATAEPSDADEPTAANDDPKADKPEEEEPLTQLFIGDEVDLDDGVYVVDAITAGRTPDGDTLHMKPWENPNNPEEPELDDNGDPIDYGYLFTRREAWLNDWTFDPAQPNRPPEAKATDDKPLATGDTLTYQGQDYYIVAVTQAPMPPHNPYADRIELAPMPPATGNNKTLIRSQLEAAGLHVAAAEPADDEAEPAAEPETVTEPA